MIQRVFSFLSLLYWRRLKNKMKNKTIVYLVGIILLIIGIFMSVSMKNPHFYTPFSIGLFLILLTIYNSLAKGPLFHKWKIKQHLIFWISLIVICIIIDKIGLFLGYWIYPYYNSFFDEILKYLFEWALPLVYFTLVLLIGTILINKLKVNLTASFVISLLILVPLSLLFTEYINDFTYSWKILSMPFTNLQIGGYLIIWITLGSWLMAIIPLILYKIAEKIK